MRTLALLAALLVAAPASAMHISTSVSVAAFSKDGASVLIEVSRSGPEGGGSNTFIVAGGKGEPKSYALSEDFSNGATIRQHIPATDCRKAAEALAKRLAADGFEKVTVNPAACEKERAGIVSLEKADRGEAGKVSIKEGRIVVQLGGATGDLGPGQADEKLEAVASRSGKLVVVISGDFDDQSLVAVARPKDGKLETIPVEAR